jgi:NADPH:quinone reductase-like Zn-dependent oxidoreductase
MEKMKAVVYTKYGPPDVLQLLEAEKPVPGDDEVLVKVHAATVNRTDSATIRAIPFFMRIFTGIVKPKKQIPGTEFAGEIEAVGKGVSSLKRGDKVFGFDGLGSKSQAQYLTIQENKAVLMPDNIPYEQAAASSEGAYYAYSCIKKANLKKGQNALVYGATGAIGTAAVQLLKYYDVNVTAVCDTKNMSLMKTIGADKVVDYTKDDYTKDEQKYSFVYDAVGKTSFFKCKHLLRAGGVFISSDLGPMAENIYLPLITPMFKSFFENKKTVSPFPADIRESLLLIRKVMELGKFNAVIDRTYALDQIVEAYRYVEKGQKTGNVVITIR